MPDFLRQLRHRTCGFLLLVIGSEVKIYLQLGIDIFLAKLHTYLGVRCVQLYKGKSQVRFAYSMGVRKGGGSCPLWILGQGVSRRALFSNSCQLQSLQLPAAFKNGYFIALLARNFQIFSRSRAYPQQKPFFVGGAREKKSIFNKIFIACTCIIHSCML